MKRIPILFTAAAMIFAAGCSSTRNASSTPDDVYYSSGDHQNQPQPASAVSPAAASDYSQDNSNYNPDQQNNYSQDNSGASSSTQQYSDGEGNTYITNNYYTDDDYYDYEYSARLRRFYTPAIGYSFYDPFYTNSYWYDYNPHNYGVSIYLGYNWWAPSFWYYDPFWFGPVFPHHHHHHHYFGYYDSWYSPYGYYGYNNYWNGYNHGYHDGYWNGYYNGMYAGTYNNPYYYNSYEGTNTYYGPRGSISSNGKASSPSPRATLGEKYQRAYEENRIPVMDPKGVTGTGVTTNPGGGRNNNSSGMVQDGKQNVSPVNSKDETAGGKNPVNTQPVRGSISDKNQSGGKDNAGGASQGPRDNGGAVRPNIEQPSRQSDFNYSRPKNDKNNVTVTPRNNNGGTVRPNVQQPRNNQYVRPGSQPGNNNPNSQPRNNNSTVRPDFNQPGNNNSENTFGQPRNEQPRNQNANPQIITPKMEPRNEQPKSNPSYERPRQEMQPRIEPRQEPRQYKQESPQPRQQNISTPSPRMQNSTPAPKNNSSSGDNKGGRRK